MFISVLHFLVLGTVVLGLIEAEAYLRKIDQQDVNWRD